MVHTLGLFEGFILSSVNARCRDDPRTVSRPMLRRDLPQIFNMSRDNMAHIIFTSWGVEWRDEDLLILFDPLAITEVLEQDGEDPGLLLGQCQGHMSVR